MVQFGTDVVGVDGSPRHRRDWLDNRQTCGNNLADRLIEWWPLNETPDTRFGRIYELFLHPGTNTGPVNGTPGTIATPLATNYLYRSAAEQTLIDGTACDLQPGNFDFAYLVWVKLSTKTADRTVLSRWNSTAGQGAYDLFYNSTVDRFKWEVAAGPGLFTSVLANTFGSPSINTWYMLYVEHNWTTKNIGVSVNAGTLNQVPWVSGIVSNSPALFLVGAWNTTFQDRMDGVVQRLGYWKRVLSADERTFLFNSNLGRDFPFVNAS